MTGSTGSHTVSNSVTGCRWLSKSNGSGVATGCGNSSDLVQNFRWLDLICSKASSRCGRGMQRRAHCTLRAMLLRCFSLNGNRGRMSRKYNFKFEVICEGNGEPNMSRVEEMIDLAMQDLVYDDEFIAALDESQSVTIRVSPILDIRAG